MSKQARTDWNELLPPLREAREKLAESLLPVCRRAVHDVANKCGLPSTEREGLDSICCCKVLDWAARAKDAKHLMKIVWRIAHLTVVDLIRHDKERCADAIYRATVRILNENSYGDKAKPYGGFAEADAAELRAWIEKKLRAQELAFARLRWDRGMKLSEVAEVMDVSESRACQIEKRIRGRMRTYLRRQGICFEKRAAKQSGRDARSPEAADEGREARAG